MSDIGAETERIAASAVLTFHDRANGSLDYSPKSLEVIEDMVHEAAPYIADMDAASVDRLVQYVGCYVLQVAYRVHGGNFFWHEGLDQPVLVVGEPDRRIGLLTWERIRQRLTGGPADSIPFFYAGFAERVARTIPGDDALYV